MKIYVAGIDTSKLKIRSPSAQFDRVQCIIKSIPEIHQDAKAALKDDDVLVLIVLREYALFDLAISNKEKKECLKKLQEGLNQYNQKNIFLIPGSIAAYKDFFDYNSEEKMKDKLYKVYNNYLTHFKKTNYQSDQEYNKNLQRCENKFFYRSINHVVCLQNTTYILSANSLPIKHKKSAPWKEEGALDMSADWGSIFYIGADNPIKNISVNHFQVKLGLVICREHFFITPETKEVQQELPLIEVLMSDYIDIDKEKLFGAINIQMDSRYGFSVYVNDSHMLTQSSGPIEIKAIAYTANLTSFDKREESIKYFDKQIDMSVNQSGISKTNTP